MARLMKAIHVCKSLDDLKKEAQCSHKLEKATAKQLISTADKLYAEAEKHDLTGDEELAYCFYFRYADAISQVQKKEDFKKERAYYEKLLSKQKLRKAIDKVDVLGISLKKRYTLLKEIEESESKAKQKEYNDAAVNTSKKGKTSGKAEVNGKPSLSSGDATAVKASLSSLNGIVKENGIGVINAGITPPELKSMLDQQAKRILFVDCRDKADFTTNHVNHSNCINIPATILIKGMSANMILNELKDPCPESYMEWFRRRTFDCIILYDWNSSFDHRLQALDIVYDALTKWDPDSMKKTSVLVVQGGMKNIYYAYPNLLTNPQSAVSGNSKLNGNGNGTSDLVASAHKLDSISYPDLDDKPKPPKPMTAPEARDTNAKVNNSSARVSSANAINHLPQPPPPSNAINDGHTVPKNVGGGMVAIDRSTKPSRLPSNARIPNGPEAEKKVVPGGVADSEENHAGLEKTDVKVKEYSQALDAVIESSKDAVRVDKEVSELRDLLSKQQHYDVDLEQKLKAKEMENEALKRSLESRNDEVSKLKSQYEAALREQKAKHILPRIRTPMEEEAIKAKQIEKEKLDELVRELRKVKFPRDSEARRDDPGRLADEQRNAENVAKLPPIPSANSSSIQRVNTGTGPTQLPAINNTNLPDPAHPPPSITKSSSTVVPSSTSRPASQDTPGITRQKLKDENSEPPRSSALKRSHSHPNIAQSHDDDLSDDLPSGSQVPRINRGLKPSGQRNNVPEVHTTPRRFARNFEVVSSTEKSKTGLKNLGNTCYMNSIIQCLSHTNKLVDYLRNEDYLKEWHPSRSTTKGEATEELAAAVKQMHSGHRSIALRDLKATIGKHHPSFRGFDQQDSHEFITILLDWLHEEMNRVAEKVPLKEQKNDGLRDEMAAERTWEDFKRSNNSRISELFSGQQKSCVTCGNCGKQSVTFEPFFILSVPIPVSAKKCDIQQCIDFYTTEEELTGWNCVHCKKKGRATKKIDLWRLPPYLIIHLQRFYLDGYWKKRLTEIDFPVDSLNLNHKALGRDSNNFIDKCPNYDYQLYGVSNHYGTMDSGHYTAYCRIPGQGSWWKFDDHEVCQINSRDVPTAAAYILFYQNRNYR